VIIGFNEEAATAGHLGNKDVAKFADYGIVQFDMSGRQRRDDI
jgi:hypothetical protein